MGWLRDLMSSASPPISSFGRLANLLLGDPDWPQPAIQARSLATLLSRLDRDVDLGWLEDRADVQVVLARRLGCPVEALSGHRAPGSVLPERRLRWRDLRFARPLELLEEPLPPGIPAEVVDPVLWGPVWWWAPHGAGRSLTGSWLAARGLARHVRARAASDFVAIAGPCFVELDSCDVDVPTFGAKLCVASPSPPRNPAAWRVVRSPDVPSVLEDIVGWVAERLPPDSDFDRDAALEWLRGEPLRHGDLDSLGSVLGLCGVLDELGMRVIRSKRALEVARHFLRRRFEETLGSETADAAWLRRNAVEALLGMARRSVTDTDSDWGAARSLDDWLALVPEQHRAGLEVEWLRVALGDSGSAVRPADIERAARRMSPGAFRIVRGLRAAGLLLPDPSDELLRPRPHWLAAAIAEQARVSLLHGSAFEWGEGLLRPHAAAEISAALLGRFVNGDVTALSDVVELEAEESPAHAAAVETAFRCAGIALLEGADIDVELLQGVWQEQANIWSSRIEALPVPRLEHVPPRSALLTRGAWHLAALAISERVQGELDLPSSVLAPWSSETPPRALGALLDSIAEAARVARAGGERWGREAYALVDRLRSALGTLSSDEPHSIELPSVVLDEAFAGVLRWQTLASVAPADAELVVWLLGVRGRGDPAELARQCWNAWHEAARPALTGTLLDPSTSGARRFWSELPSEWLGAALARAAPGSVGDALDEPQWLALIESGALAASPELALRVSELIPREPARRWLPSLASGAALARLWQRHPELFAAELGKLFASLEDEALAELLELAPAGRVPSALRALAEGAELGARLRPSQERAVIAWLHGWVAARRPEWRAAYALMSRLES